MSHKSLVSVLMGIALAFAVAQSADACPKKKSKKSEDGTTVSSKASSTSSSTAKVTFIQGTEERTTERERRLRRECKGKTNAGACAGYTN
jgi:hypothetical protein